MISVDNLSKTFTLHNQGGQVIPVIAGAGFSVAPGECVALTGESGAGKSTVMRILYGNYLAHRGAACGSAGDPDRSRAARDPGAAARDAWLCQPVPARGAAGADARCGGRAASGAWRRGGEAFERARGLADRLRIPETLWSLSPTTFSGGEQQRVNIARGFAHRYPRSAG
jgi:alpha-D-ribose 1-methylphosphonate 5-triphosphate synthase subunit PhnL